MYQPKCRTHFWIRERCHKRPSMSPDVLSLTCGPTPPVHVTVHASKAAPDPLVPLVGDRMISRAAPENAPSKTHQNRPSRSTRRPTPASYLFEPRRSDPPRHPQLREAQ